MARFNCNDCVMFGTDACRFGANHRDYSDCCDDMLVEQDHAYNKAIDDVLKLNKHNHYNMYNDIMYQSIKVSDISQLKGAEDE